MTYLKPIHTGLKYDHVVGTGGIGSGIFFLLEGNDILGRNESRLGSLLPCKDFCKQHIILHYISVLLEAGSAEFQVFPIGKVGNDDTGKKLLQTMKAAGMHTGSVSICDDCSTLFSVCFQYPDHSGGNITTQESASSKLTPGDIRDFFGGFHLSGEREIIIAAPEVPISARIKLLEYGRKRKSLNVACLLSSEVDAFTRMQGFEMVDILSINIDEAGSIAEIKDESVSSNTIVDACIKVLHRINPGMSIFITDGANGSYCFANNTLEHTPSLDVPVSSTAGAGDAFLAGSVVGLCCGLPLVKGTHDRFFSETPLGSAAELGTLLAALTVTSPDTIHMGADAALLYEFASEQGMKFGNDFLKIFQDLIIVKHEL